MRVCIHCDRFAKINDFFNRHIARCSMIKKINKKQMIRDANFEIDDSISFTIYESNSNVVEFYFEFNDNDFDEISIDEFVNVVALRIKLNIINLMLSKRF